ncbi:Uncharacterized protein FWK35_00032170, partial [Aphis craccivora]
GLVPKQLFAEIKKVDNPISKHDKVESWLLSNDFRYYSKIENTSKDNTIENNELSLETKVIEATEESISNYNTIQSNELNVKTMVIEKTKQSISKDNTIQNNELSVGTKVIEATEHSISNYNTIQNGFDILDLDSMEFIIDSEFIIQPEQNISSTNLVISESTQIQIPVPDFSITIPQISTDLDSTNEESIPNDELENYGTARKKRQPKSVPNPKAVSDDEDALLFSEVTISNLEEHTPLTQKNQQQQAALQTELSPINLRRETMKMFLDEIPKLPSHYCRQSSSKLYVQSDIKSYAQLYQLYIEYSNNVSVQPLSRFSFDRMCRAEKISIFSPRKDQCDLCCQYKAGNLSDNSFNAHRKKKDEARAQKEADKKSAVEKQCYTLCCDLMAVKLVPQLQASSLYYKMKLAVHNFTVYNLETHDVICYWFDESQTDLVASSFASCLIDAVEELLDKSGPRPIVNIFSDGCTYQNRNSILSNALLDLSIRKNVTINQKYLEKGHTQMEADSVHSVLEGAMRNRDIYLPSQFIDITKNARKNPFPYRVKFVDWQFFRDFSKPNHMIYDSIRPGKKSGDPVVTDLRWLQYNSSGQIKYALDFFTELQPLPIRPKTNIITEKIIFPPLNSGPVKIPKDKWKDLQDIKPVLPHDCHNYYDVLPHADISYRQNKKAEKEKAKR